MRIKVGEIADILLINNVTGEVILKGEMYNPNSTPREIELAKRVRELEKITKQLKGE